MMTADIVESAKMAVDGAHDDQRFARKLRGYKLSGTLKLINACHHLPGSAEHLLSFNAGDALIDVPGGRYGVGVCERGLIVIGKQNVAQRQFHRTSPACSREAMITGESP